MADNVLYSNDAKLDVHRAKCYLDFVNKGNEFLDDLFQQEHIISLMPEAFQIRYQNMRLIRLSNFDYYIHYTYRDRIIRIHRVTNHISNY